LVWGSSVKHQPQKVGKDHILGDEDVIQIVKKYVRFIVAFRVLIVINNNIAKV